MHRLLLGFLLLLLLVEGLGIHFGREISFFLIIFLFPLLFVYTFFSKSSFVLPRKITYIFGCYLSLMLISTLFSVDKRMSVGYLFYTISLMLAFFIAYNYQGVLQKGGLKTVVILAAFTFCAYSFALNFRLLKLFVPESGYQFVLSRFVSHNHLGDFLVIPIIFMLYNIYNKRNIGLSLLFIALSTPFTLLSYSRSAYLAIMVTFFILHVIYLKKTSSKTIKTVFRFSLLLLLVLGIFFSITITREGLTRPIPSTINSFLVKNNNLNKDKSIHGSRALYFKQAYLTIKDYPLVGTGPDTFLFASRKYAVNKVYDVTQSAHNIFLEIAATMGIGAFVVFAVLLAYLFAHSRKNGLFYAMTALFIMFQTDYIYQLYSLLLLFLIIAGTVYKENTHFHFSGLRKKILLK